MNIDKTTIYRILNFGAKSWWAHKQLRDMGKHVEARREERRNILDDLETVRSALYILIGHGRFVIVTGPHSTVSGYGELEHPLVLACVLRGAPCVEYSTHDRETTIILPVPGSGRMFNISLASLIFSPGPCLAQQRPSHLRALLMLDLLHRRAITRPVGQTACQHDLNHSGEEGMFNGKG